MQNKLYCISSIVSVTEAAKNCIGYIVIVPEGEKKLSVYFVTITEGRREIIIVKGQSYVLRLPKY
jgi:hypothetical protein